MDHLNDAPEKEDESCEQECLKDQLMLWSLLFVLLVVPQLQGCAAIHEMNTSTQHCFRGNEEISCFDYSIPF